MLQNLILLILMSWRLKFMAILEVQESRFGLTLQLGIATPQPPFKNRFISESGGPVELDALLLRHQY
jgi:hypothetical protein